MFICRYYTTVLNQEVDRTADQAMDQAIDQATEQATQFAQIAQIQAHVDESIKRVSQETAELERNINNFMGQIHTQAEQAQSQAARQQRSASESTRQGQTQSTHARRWVRRQTARGSRSADGNRGNTESRGDDRTYVDESIPGVRTEVKVTNSGRTSRIR